MAPMTCKKNITVPHKSDKIIHNSLNCSRFISQPCEQFQTFAVQLWPINSLACLRCMLFTYYYNIIIYYTSINGSWTNYDDGGDVLTCHNNNIIKRQYCKSNARVLNASGYNIIKSHRDNAYDIMHIFIFIVVVVTQFIFCVKMQLD